MAKTNNGLSKLKKLAELQAKQFPAVKMKFMVDTTGELVKAISARTPVDTGRLRAGFHAQNPKFDGGVYVISCTNNVEYAEFVEYGHRWVKRGFANVKLEDYNPETDKTGFTKGKHMAELGAEDTVKGLQARWDKHIQKWMDMLASKVK